MTTPSGTISRNYSAWDKGNSQASPEITQFFALGQFPNHCLEYWSHQKMEAPLTWGGRYQISGKQKQLESAGWGIKEGATEEGTPSKSTRENPLTVWPLLTVATIKFRASQRFYRSSNTSREEGTGYNGAPVLLDFDKNSLLYLMNFLTSGWDTRKAVLKNKNHTLE